MPNKPEIVVPFNDPCIYVLNLLIDTLDMFKTWNDWKTKWKNKLSSEFRCERKWHEGSRPAKEKGQGAAESHLDRSSNAGLGCSTFKMAKKSVFEISLRFHSEPVGYEQEGNGLPKSQFPQM